MNKNFKVLDVAFDKVLKSYYITMVISYDDVVEYLLPQITKWDFQRNTLNEKYYKRLEKDILNGCVIPNITLAIIKDDMPDDINNIDNEYVKNNINKAFILDGIQRINTIGKIYSDANFPKSGKVYCNLLICNSVDRLLYRMITLNNGQKPMTARHQIEILSDKILDFDTLPILIASEKEKKYLRNKSQEYFDKDTIVKGYLAYLSGSINIDNQKIIESKMDELIADQIMESNIIDKHGEFTDVIKFVEIHTRREELMKWFKLPNNFIGFCAAMNKAYMNIKNLDDDELCQGIILFESAFESLDVSKIKLGLTRRKLVKMYFEKFETFSNYSVLDLLNELSME